MAGHLWSSASIPQKPINAAASIPYCLCVDYVRFKRAATVTAWEIDLICYVKLSILPIKHLFICIALEIEYMEIYAFSFFVVIVATVKCELVWLA